MTDGRVRVERLPDGGTRILFDGRMMGEVRGEVEVWDDGVRVKSAQAWSLPEGTVVMDVEGECCLAPSEHPQLLIYPHGRLARVWQEEDGAMVMVFGDSPTALMNEGLRLPSKAVEGNRKQSSVIESNRWLRDIFIAGRAAHIGEGTPAAQRAMAVLQGDVRWLRGEIDQFIMGVRHDADGLWLAGVTLAPRVWTLRLGDFLGEGFFRMTLWRDGLNVDGEASVGREVEEIFEGVTRDDKPAVEMVKGGGFVARFEPCHETEFKMVKGERE